MRRPEESPSLCPLRGPGQVSRPKAEEGGREGAEVKAGGGGSGRGALPAQGRGQEACKPGPAQPRLPAGGIIPPMS